MRYKAIVKYNGTHYFGWQRQVKDISVQAVIEEKLSVLLNEPITIYASGRTDALVHARGQVFHFDAKIFPSRKLKYALNRMLPSDIEIITLLKTKENFHARYDAKLKAYEYVIKLSAKDPFHYNAMLLYPFPLNTGKLQQYAQAFVGRHNFQNFTSKSEDEAGFVRDIKSVAVKKRGDIIKITFTGTGFMRGQIRFMVGTLLAVNEGKENDTFIRDTLNVSARRIVPYKVSGHGLYLDKVWY